MASAVDTPSRPRSIASGRHLASFHAARGAAYGAFVDLLAGPADVASLRRIWPRLQEICRWMQSPAASERLLLALRTPGADRGEMTGPVVAVTEAPFYVCPDPDNVERMACLRAAGVAGVRAPAVQGEAFAASSRLAELAALGALALQAAEALRNNDVARAAAASDFQARLLGHGAPCLGAMCRRLMVCRDDYYPRVARVLAWVLEQDVWLLDAREYDTSAPTAYPGRTG